MEKLFREWWWAILGLLAILGLGIGLRLYHLTIIPVFADEAIYIRWAQVMGAEPTLRFLPLSDGKQPLFMWILMFFVRRMSDPLFAGRLLSVASGLGTMIGVFAVSYLLFKSKLVSLTATLIYALSPFTFFFDRMALVDSMLATFGIWVLFFGILTARSKRLDMAMITGFFLGGALLTKSPALFFVLLLPTTWIFIKKPKDLIKLIPFLLVTYLIGYGMYNILRLGPNFQLISSRNQDYIFPISHLWTDFKDPFISHIHEIFTDWFIKMGPWPIFGLIVAGLVFDCLPEKLRLALQAGKKYWKEKFLLIVWCLAPLLVQAEYAKVFTVRYIIYTLPPLFILAASAFSERKSKILIACTIGILLLFIGVSFWFDREVLVNPDKANLPSSERSGYLEEWTAGTGIKEISEYLKTEEIKNPKQKIVVGTEGYFGTLPDGLQMYLNDRPEITVIGVGLDFTKMPSSLLESLKAGNSTYFVVNKSRLNKDPETLGLELVAAYPKSLRRETGSKEYQWYGPQEVLLFYQLKK